MTIERPFFVLSLPPEATGREVTDRGNDLLAENPAADREREIRDALDQLQLSADERVRHELFEPPGPAYLEHDRAFERFCRRHKNNPIDVPKLLADLRPPTPADIDVTRLLDLALDAWLERPGPDLLPAVDAGPTDTGVTQATMDLRDVLFT